MPATDCSLDPWSPQWPDFLAGAVARFAGGAELPWLPVEDSPGGLEAARGQFWCSVAPSVSGVPGWAWEVASPFVSLSGSADTQAIAQAICEALARTYRADLAEEAAIWELREP